MPQALTSVNLQLEESLLNAESGDRQVLRRFFSAFLEGPLLVPDRNQLHIPLNSATYPNDFLRILAIQDGERTIVPVFSRLEFAEEWANHPLTTNSYSGEKLVRLLPDDWWICVNPAQDIEKDLSPWEIKKLVDGEKNFDEIINEIVSDETPSLLAVEVVTGMQELTDTLSKEAVHHKFIDALYLGKHQDLQALQNQDELILAIIVSQCDFSIRQNIKERFEAIASSYLIGQGSLRVLVENSKQSVVIGSFRDISPIYIRQSTPIIDLISRSYGTIRKWLKKK